MSDRIFIDSNFPTGHVFVGAETNVEGWSMIMFSDYHVSLALGVDMSGNCTADNLVALMFKDFFSRFAGHFLPMCFVVRISFAVLR
jgi:hypothetical protein